MTKEDAASAEEEESADSEEQPVKKKFSGKIIILIAGALLLVLGVGAGAYMFLFADKSETDETAVDEHGVPIASHDDLVFYELPTMLVNLNANDESAKYLKLKVSIELESRADIAQIEPLMPRIIDRFQVYLRELRVSELSGSAGMFQLKQELLRRINLAVPVNVKDVLFTEMIIQ